MLREPYLKESLSVSLAHPTNKKLAADIGRRHGKRYYHEFKGRKEAFQ